MITIYQTSGQELLQRTEPVDGSWINAISPSPEEIVWLHGLGIPQDYITYSLDVDEQPRTERENHEQLILFRIPCFQGLTSDVPYTTVPLGIILTDRFMITLCRQENDVLNELGKGRLKDIQTSKRNRFVLRLLLSTASKYLVYLREINKRVDELEDQLQLSTRNKEVLELLKYQKSLTYFTTALKSNELMMQRLQRSLVFKTYPEDEDLLEDVLTEIQQAIEMTNISSNILSSMMDAFASIISNNLNTVMKLLASLTIILSLPTMIASFFGMNVALPMQSQNFAFAIILAISLLISLLVIFVFLKRDWL